MTVQLLPGEEHLEYAPDRFEHVGTPCGWPSLDDVEEES